MSQRKIDSGAPPLSSDGGGVLFNSKKEVVRVNLLVKHLLSLPEDTFTNKTLEGIIGEYLINEPKVDDFLQRQQIIITTERKHDVAHDK